MSTKKAIDVYREFFSVVKLGPFCEKFTTINPKRRLYHNLQGKSTGGHDIDDLHPDDVLELNVGVKKWKQTLPV